MVTGSVSARDVTGSCVIGSGSLLMAGFVTEGSMSVGSALMVLSFCGVSGICVTACGVVSFAVVLSVMLSGEGVVAQAFRPSRTNSGMVR